MKNTCKTHNIKYSDQIIKVHIKYANYVTSLSEYCMYQYTINIKPISYSENIIPFLKSYWHPGNSNSPPDYTLFIALQSVSKEVTKLTLKAKKCDHKTCISPKGGKSMGFTDDSKSTLIKPVHGIKRQIINLEDTIISTFVRQIKAKYGIEISAWNPGEISILTDWVKDHDPNFKNHITNPYALNDTKSNKYVLCGVFFIKVAKDTYVFVDAEKWRFKSREDNEYTPIYMYIFGKKSAVIFKKLASFINAKNMSKNRIFSITGVKNNNETYWNCTASKLTPRTIDTIFMNAEQKKRITDHIDQWRKNEEMYLNRGLLFKTGILLHGKAGTGKSSMAMAIANYLGCGLITIDPTTFQYMNIPEITESIVADETTYVILIDEIDTLFVSRDNQDASEIQKEKTAKLLSFLDSPQSPTNVIFVATTNYIERLDKALLRKGRFDIVEEMGNVDRDVAMEMIMSFDLTEEDGNELLNGNDTVNPAQLQDSILSLIKARKQKKAEEELDRITDKLSEEGAFDSSLDTLDEEEVESTDTEERCDLVKVISSKKYDSDKEYIKKFD